MAVYLTEEDVEAVLSIEDAVEAVEGSFRRQAAGEIDNRPRYRIGLDGGQLAVMAACDLGIGVAGVKTYAAGANGARFVVVLFDAASQELLAVIDADHLGRLRTGAATGVAAKHLAKEGATDPRRDRLRQPGGDAGRGRAGGAAGDRRGVRVLSRSRPARGVRQAARARRP